MYLHFGKKAYGKCDAVPEMFYVATVFFHVDFLPLVPLETYLILDKKGDRGVKIPFSFKSLFCAWARTGFLIGAIIGWVLTIVCLSDTQMGREYGWGPLAAALLLSAGYGVAMVLPRRANYERACELGRHAQLDERGWAALNVLYGRDPLEQPWRGE